MQVSSAFVVIMGMGVTFVGLTCIIFLTMLMGKILSKPEAPKPAAAAAVPAAPAGPADGLTDEEAAEHAALRQEYIAGFRENMRQVLENTYVQRPDGTKTKLQKKTPTK